MPVSKTFKIGNGKTKILFVGQNCGFHGINHLFKPNASLLSRVIWLLVIMASLGGLYLMMEPVAELGVKINYTPDTFYLDWTTTFPGVTVCEEPRIKEVQHKFEALYPDLLKPLTFDHRRFLSELVFARKKCSHRQCESCGTTIDCDAPRRQIIERIHRSCNEIMSDCSYNGEEFICCHLYRSVDSEHGPCFSFNTLQHNNPINLRVMNRSTGPGALRFRLLCDAEVKMSLQHKGRILRPGEVIVPGGPRPNGLCWAVVYMLISISIHSSEELSTNKLDIKLKNIVRTNSFNYVDWLFSVVEIENDKLLQAENVQERRCRFLYEIPDRMLHTYPVYSHGACRLAYNTEKTFAHCGCIHPVRDLSYKDNYCNYTGMNCWNTFEDLRIKLGVENGNVINECLPSCVESELTTIHFFKKWETKEDNKPGTWVNIKMVSLPTLRYQRNLIKTHLDLVVAVGGIAGLFFSASILSFLEIFYLIFRPQKFKTLK